MKAASAAARRESALTGRDVELTRRRPPEGSGDGGPAALARLLRPGGGGDDADDDVTMDLDIDQDAEILLNDDDADDRMHRSVGEARASSADGASRPAQDARVSALASPRSLPLLDSAQGWPMEVLEFARRTEALEDGLQDGLEGSPTRRESADTAEDDWAVYDARANRAHETPRGDARGMVSDRLWRADASSPPPPPPAESPSAASSGASPLPLPALHRAPAAAAAKQQKRGSTAIGDFDVTHMIGKGAFGRVLLATKRSGTEKGRAFAVKVLEKDVVRSTGQAAHTRAERATLASLRHPFVVRLRYAFQSRDRLYLVTDYYAGGSLERHLDDAHPAGLGDARTKLYAAELVAALRHCHHAGVVHRDIKPGNVLLDAQGHVALTDFGLCALGVVADGAPLRSFCGTVTYMAPELLVGQTYGTSVDWWALGALVFEMAAGRPPFEDPNRRRMFYAILHLPPPFPLHFSNELIELITGLLEKRPDRRLGVKRPTAAAPRPRKRRSVMQALTPRWSPALALRGESGSSESGGREETVDHVKEVSYFSDLDWADVVARAVVVPWLPTLNGPNDLAYVPKIHRDHRSQSLEREFGGDTNARISRQQASFQATDTETKEDVDRLRARSGQWLDFSFSAPPRGETVLGRNQLPVRTPEAKEPKGDAMPDSPS